MKSHTPSPHSHWQNRIVGADQIAPNLLLANPRNWRVHPTRQQALVAGALGKVGWVRQVLVNKRTGRIVDGHLRVHLAMQHDEPTVPVLYVDLSEEEETAVLATLDPLTGLAEANTDRLQQLLDELSMDRQSLDDLFGALSDSEEEKFPDSAKEHGGLTPRRSGGQQPGFRETYQILVTCGDEAEQSRLLQQLDSDGYQCRALVF